MARRLRRLVSSREGSVDQAQNELYDWWTEQVIARVVDASSNCVDVGAHDGAILREMVSRAPRGTHWAFEPLPAYAERLRVRYPGVRVMQMALADEPGVRPFRHVLSSAGYSGFERCPGDTYEERVEIIQVNVERLDALVPLDLPIALIKIDVEGFEYLVLKGGIELLRRDRPVVVFEVGLKPKETWKVLVEAAGLRIWRPDTWLAGGGFYSSCDEFVDSVTPTNWCFVAACHESRSSTS